MSHILSIKNLKQMMIVALMMIGALLMAHYGVYDAHAQLTGPGDSPDNITYATGGEDSFKALAKTIINYFLYFLGFVATVMIIYGGAQYVTAAGAQEKVDNAKKVITYAIIGMIVVLLSYALVNTVLQSATPGAQPQS